MRIGLRVHAAHDGSNVSQMAIQPGETYDYEFTLTDAGTFWFHPHLTADEQIERGLAAAIVVRGDDEIPVDSERMLLRVERGKGGRHRNAMLSADLLALLRQWWKVGRQQGVMHRDGWLFPGQHPMKPISTRQLHRIVVEAAQARAGARVTAELKNGRLQLVVEGANDE